jgi:hypothetical protein
MDRKGGLHMAFADRVKQGWEAAQLKKETIEQLAGDQEAIGPAIGILVIGGICAGIGSFSLPGMFILPVARLVGAFIFVALVHFVATTFFGGKGEILRLAVPVFCASVISWATIVPFVGPWLIGPLTGLWLLVVMVVATEHVYGIERGKAIGAVALPLAVFLIIGAFLAILAGVSMLALTGRLCI